MSNEITIADITGLEIPEGQLDYKALYGRKITKAYRAEARDFGGNNEGIILEFEDGSKAAVYDDARYCCESRYISCDDPFDKIVDGYLVSIETKPGPNIKGVYDDTETCFVDIVTTEGTLTFTTHNEHNGYYGGFELAINLIN